MTCTLMETNGAGYYTTSTGYWEAETDGAVTVKFEPSKGMSAIVAVYWVDSQTHDVPAPEEEAFAPAEAKELAEKQITEVMGKVSGYDHAQCGESTKALLGALTTSLVALSKPYKYIVSCTLLQRAPTSVNECGPYGTWDREGEE